VCSVHQDGVYVINPIKRESTWEHTDHCRAMNSFRSVLKKDDIKKNPVSQAAVRSNPQLRAPRLRNLLHELVPGQLKLPVDVRGHTTLAACCPGLELPDITAVSSSKMSRLSPSLCVALQPTPHHVSAVSGLAWCACSQPRRLGAHARFHAVHASSCLLLSSTSCCTDDVLVRERL